MDAAQYQQLVARQMSEKTLQAQVELIARTCGWLVFHARDSRGSQPGFPDLCLVRAPRVVFAELKTERGRTSTDQDRWLAELRKVSERSGNMLTRDRHHRQVEAHVWRPRHVIDDTVHEALR